MAIMGDSDEPTSPSKQDSDTDTIIVSTEQDNYLMADMGDSDEPTSPSKQDSDPDTSKDSTEQDNDLMADMDDSDEPTSPSKQDSDPDTSTESAEQDNYLSPSMVGSSMKPKNKQKLDSSQQNGVNPLKTMKKHDNPDKNGEPSVKNGNLENPESSRAQEQSGTKTHEEEEDNGSLSSGSDVSESFWRIRIRSDIEPFESDSDDY